MRAIITNSQAQRTTLQLVNATSLQAAKINQAVVADVDTLNNLTADLDTNVGALNTLTTGLDVNGIDISLTDLDARVTALETP